MGAVTTGLCNSQARAYISRFLAQFLAECLPGFQLRALFFDLFLRVLFGAAAFLDLLQHPAQQAARQRTPRDDAQTVCFAGREHFQFDHAVFQVIQTLLANQPHVMPGFGALLGLGDMPPGKIG